ncbi:YkvA family protein [Luteolibacter sp. AS25]|uniref:YkvA family protein n=1 Tax=Luteolibacter sp. AS25 TaxID=3135776 RepID=UPI00398B9F3F
MRSLPSIKKSELKAHIPEAFSMEGFWAVVTKLSKRGGRKVMEAGLTLFFCLKDPETPKWAKSVIIGALGYLIFPMDFLPDAVIGLGFTDDWSVLLGAMGAVVAHIKEEHKARASDVSDRILGIGKKKKFPETQNVG